MTEFHKALFRTNHKSFYTHQDVTILDECRSIVPSGSFTKGVDNHLVEVDISKAFTAAFCSIKEIPIFNDFDNFKLYSDLPIKKLSLYIVKVKTYNLFVNLTYQNSIKKLVQGKSVILDCDNILEKDRFKMEF